MTKGIAATAIAGGALALGSGLANAAPAKPAKPVKSHVAPVNPHRVSVGLAQGVTYTGDAKSGAAEITTPWGVLKTTNGRFAVSDTRGKTVYGDPKLKGLQASNQRPVTMTNSPFQPGKAAATNPAAEPKKALTAAEKEEAVYGAIGNVATHFGFAYGVGAMVGGVAGAAIGCPIGAVAMQVSVPVPVLPVVLGCVVGAGTIGTTGAILGGAAVAVPVAVASGSYEVSKLAANGVLG
ncbi:hypothetical protein [Gordonia crocea]|uniref:hypothetical protein n=1 Tax=Gordonia crocea TaxID=589162 RepID=UPI001E5FAB38|nr:hypothetical protein [Gordonia crocea]